jgi:hypothetical protein
MNEVVSKTLSEIAETVKQRQDEAQATYQQLVRAVADGQAVETKEAETVLSAANKTMQDLKADVEKKLHLRDVHQQLQLQDQLETEEEELKAKREAELARRTEFLLQSDKVLAPIDDRLEQISKKKQHRVLLEQELRKNMTPEQQEEMDAITAENLKLPQHIDMYRAIQKAKAESRPDPAYDPTRPHRSPRQVAEAAEQVKALEQQERDAEAKRAELARKLEDLDRRILTTME